MRLDREQLVELGLAHDIAWAIARLTQIKQLLEPDQFARCVGPAARGPAGVELAGRCQIDLIGLDAQRSEPARGTVGEHRPHQLAAVRDVVVQPRLHDDLLHRRCEPFRPILVNVEQGRGIAQRARVRLVAQPGELDPMRLVGRQGQRVEGGDVSEEIALGGRGIDAHLPGQRGAIIRLVGENAGGDQQIVKLGGARLDHLAVGDGVADFGDRRQVAVARFLQPQRRQRTVELALEKHHLVVPAIGAQEDVLEVPIVLILADAGGAGAARRLGLDPLREIFGRGARLAHRRSQRRAGTVEPHRPPPLKAVERQSPGLKRGQCVGLFIEGAVAKGPQVVRLAWREIAFGLGEHRRHVVERRGELGVVGSGQRPGKFPQVDIGLGRRPFMGWNIAHFGKDRLIETGVARPRLERAQEEVEAIDLRFEQPRVILVRNAPAGLVDCRQPLAPNRQRRLFGRHCGGTVIGQAGSHCRADELPPLGE